MRNNHIICCIGFGEQSFVIDCNNDDALGIAEFLFADFSRTGNSYKSKQFDIISTGTQPMLSLWDGDKILYHGTSRYQLAYILMNEVIYHCITADKENIALHAGAVFKGNRCLLLPGKSGKGKSTLTGWLIQNGFNYLTDELVFLCQNGAVLPLVRPLNFKATTHTSWSRHIKNKNIVLEEATGSMIPHRMLNPNFDAASPILTDIVFPEYRAHSSMTFEEISPAKSCLYLLQTHVNAKNLKDHGIALLSAIIKRCRSYKLRYSHFSELEKVFCEFL